MFNNEVKYDFDYPQEPIGNGNPYNRCASCKRSAPEINGDLNKHGDGCEYVKKVKLKKVNK